VTHADYVAAFYTGALFKVERRLLAWFVARPSTDVQARQLADGTLDAFAAWTVEARATDQLLMCDFQGRTRSWLMVAPVDGSPTPCTRLYFGSAVVPAATESPDRDRRRLMFRALLGFHRAYSRALLGAACARVGRHARVD
jgi:hypothetical protein